MIHASPALVIAGSLRPQRIALRIAEWVAEIGRETMNAAVEVVDLKAWPLPMDDEPGVPAAGVYEHEHTRAWSRKIAGGGAFVFVTPQYNWGYPAPLKNALDFLYREWHGKPATSVTYGTRGGGKAADQIHQVFEGLHMRPLGTRIEVAIADDHVNQDWQLTDVAAAMGPYASLIRQLDAEIIEALQDSQ
jgi:NAD(P)H-dependent FMN reductase